MRKSNSTQTSSRIQTAGVGERATLSSSQTRRLLVSTPLAFTTTNRAPLENLNPVLPRTNKSASAQRLPPTHDLAKTFTVFTTSKRTSQESKAPIDFFVTKRLRDSNGFEPHSQRATSQHSTRNSVGHSDMRLLKEKVKIEKFIFDGSTSRQESNDRSLGFGIGSLPHMESTVHYLF